MNNAKMMASYVTLKELFGKGNYKSYYELISEYIIFIARENNLHELRIEDISNRLEDEFGFRLPLMVIKNSIKCIKNVSIKNDSYIISDITDKQTNIKEINDNSDNLQLLIDDLYKYAEQKNEKIIDKNKLLSSLMAYLIDDIEYCEDNIKYVEIISKYIVSIEDDIKKQEILKSIREGSIIYTGLNSYISDIGGFRKNLHLYFDTEILFNIVGYNGEIYKQLALDMLKQIKQANNVKQRISISYFDITKKEIEMFFNSAEDIVENKKEYIDKPAMLSIINGCNDRSDVLVKKADFYTTLDRNGITLDDSNDFYIENNYKYVLEGNTKEKDCDEYAENIDYINRINILRKGKIHESVEDAEYIFITETRYALKLSKELCESKTFDYAINTNKITNLLWYKLGSCFGSKTVFPSNVNVLLKAKIILSNIIVNSISELYSDCKKQYKKGVIDKNTLENRILALHEKAIKPEDISSSNFEESLDFSYQFFNSYENAIALKEKEIIEEKHKYDKVIEDKDNKIYNQKERIKELEKELNKSSEFQDKYKKLDNIIKTIKKTLILLKNIVCDVWKDALICAIVLIASVYIRKNINEKTISIILEIVSIFSPIYFLVKPLMNAVIKNIEKVKYNK